MGSDSYPNKQSGEGQSHLGNTLEEDFKFPICKEGLRYFWKNSQPFIRS